MLKLWVRKHLQFYADNCCVSKPMALLCFFLIVFWVGLQSMNVAVPGYTHLPFDVLNELRDRA